MKRLPIFLYGVASYAVSLAVFLYAFGFIGNFWVPKSMDSPRDVPLMSALLINLTLLGLFAVQHSVMARPWFKRWWTRFVPQAAERSTYLLFSNICMVALFWFWQPMGGVIWNITSPAGVNAMYALYAGGWVLLLYATFLINHFDLFGLRQVWLHLRGKPYSPLPFASRCHGLRVPGRRRHQHRAARWPCEGTAQDRRPSWTRARPPEARRPPRCHVPGPSARAPWLPARAPRTSCDRWHDYAPGLPARASAPTPTRLGRAQAQPAPPQAEPSIASRATTPCALLPR
jgi:protein-S-isoprenylcysteine O-methyltransferase Ste14